MSRRLAFSWNDHYDGEWSKIFIAIASIFLMAVNQRIASHAGFPCSMMAIVSLLLRWYFLFQLSLYLQVLLSIRRIHRLWMSFNLAVLGLCVAHFRWTSGRILTVGFLASQVWSAWWLFGNFPIYFRESQRSCIWCLANALLLPVMAVWDLRCIPVAIAAIKALNGSSFFTSLSVAESISRSLASWAFSVLPITSVFQHCTWNKKHSIFLKSGRTLKWKFPKKYPWTGYQSCPINYKSTQRKFP